MKKLLCTLLIITGFGSVKLFAQHTTQDGDVDSSFGVNGTVKCNYNDYPYSEAVAVAPMPNNEIALLVVLDDTAHNPLIGLLKLSKSGNVDSAFGINGIAAFDKSFHVYALSGSIACDAQGRIVTVATGRDSTISNHTGYLINRYLPNGQPDSTFHNMGTSIAYFSDSDISVNRFAIQADGKYVVIGNCGSGNNVGALVFIRFNTDGSIDSNFGNPGGSAIINRNTKAFYLSSFAIQPDGRYLITGEQANGTSFLFRINTNGNIDSSFGKFGNAVIANQYQVNAITLLPNNKILAAGNIHEVYPREDFLLARYDANGTIDSSFGTNGTTHNNISGDFDIAFLIGVQTDNKIVLGGQSDNGIYQQELARYTENGILDSTFGINGSVIHSTDTSQYVANLVNGMTIQPDGNIMMVGYVDNGYYQYFASRYIAHPYKLTTPSVQKNITLLTVYPNPTTGTFTLSAISTIGNATITVCDMLGKTVYTTQHNFISSSTTTINVANQPAGVYFIKVQDNNARIQVVKLLKQ